MRASCSRSPFRADGAGSERPIRPAGHVAADPGPDTLPGSMPAGCPWLLAGLLGPLPLLPRHGRLRRNAVSPHGVSLSGAPGAPLWIGCSSANRALAGKFFWDGIVAVPKVFGAGCPVPLSTEEPSAGEQGQPGRSANSGDTGEPYDRPGAPWLISLTCGYKACGNMATHGGAQGVAGFVDIRRLAEQRESILAPRGAAIPGRRA